MKGVEKLGVVSMDALHDDFLEILSAIQECERDAFMPLFVEMLEQTKEHFAFEEAVMQEEGFYGMQEHCAEHENLLGEMNYFYEKARRVPALGKAYIHDYAYEKFRRHVANIDSQLAMFLKEKEHQER